VAAHAVPAHGVDAGVAWHYGNPFGETQALADGTAIVDLSHYGVVRVAGGDRLTWLNDLVTADV
jgi:glycine cleavage system aminomethyltransferase T